MYEDGDWGKPADGTSKDDLQCPTHDQTRQEMWPDRQISSDPRYLMEIPEVDHGGHLPDWEYTISRFHEIRSTKSVSSFDLAVSAAK